MARGDDQFLESWFHENSIDYGRSAISLAPVEVLAHAWFNCETAQMAIRTAIADPCQECEIQSKCKHLPKAPEVSLLTGDGDGDYLVWALINNKIPKDATYFADGALVILNSEVHSTVVNKFGKLIVETPPLAPLVIGKVLVEPHVSSTGTQDFGFIFLSDLEATTDSDFFIVDLPLAPGEYTVVAFMGEAMFQDISPRMIGIYGPSFQEALMETIGANAKVYTEAFTEAVNCSEDGTVLSRANNNLDLLSEKNSAIAYERNALLSDSWSMQRYFAGSEAIQKRMDEFLPQSKYSPLQWLRLADGLRIRGQKQKSNAILINLLNSGIKLSPNLDAYLMAIMRSKAGVWHA
jgi:hypothetical protein